VRDLTHPDLHWVFPRPRLKDADASPDEVRADYADAIAERAKTHGLYAAPSGSEGIFISTVRALAQDAAMSPAISRRKVFIVGDAERMVAQEGTDMAANAFLKLLEEPPANSTIILTSSEPGALLPTIRSRVVAVRVTPISESEVKAFVEDPIVKEFLDELDKSSSAERARKAEGAPGRLLNGDDGARAILAARRILDAALAPRTATKYATALAQGAANARGAYSDTLDALVTLLGERMRESLHRDDAAGAAAASRAVDVALRAKQLAGGNVSPQLITSRVIREISELVQ
jgi:DNA polymerase-3 subunit delta'